MQEKLPLREAVVGVGVLAGSCWYRLSAWGPRKHRPSDWVSQHPLGTLPEASKNPEVSSFSKSAFFNPAGSVTTWESFELQTLRHQIIFPSPQQGKKVTCPEPHSWVAAKTLMRTQIIQTSF